MNADALDWMPDDEAVTHVETAVKCYRGRAIGLLEQAAYELKLKSRTCPNELRWVVEERDGVEIIYADKSERIEFYRKDVFALWPKDATQSTRLKRSSPTSEAVLIAIKNLWGGEIPAGLRAKDRDYQICEELKRIKISVSTRTIQRVVQKMRQEQQIQS